jgi:hypothetical protein
MRAFERYFCTTGLTDEALQSTIQKALEIDELMLGATDEDRDSLRLSYEGLGSFESTDVPPVINMERTIRRQKRLEETQSRVAARKAELAKKAQEREERHALRLSQITARKAALAKRAQERAERHALREARIAARTAKQAALASGSGS